MVTPPADITDTYIYGFSTTAVVSGHTYHVSITDGCGDSFVGDYVVPTQAPPAIISKGVTQRGCIDSIVGAYNVHATGFLNGKLIITSGPATLGSTKPEYQYSDTYSYPIPDGARESACSALTPIPAWRRRYPSDMAAARQSKPDQSVTKNTLKIKDLSEPDSRPRQPERHSPRIGGGRQPAGRRRCCGTPARPGLAKPAV